jgi:hypothetical protein
VAAQSPPDRPAPSTFPAARVLTVLGALFLLVLVAAGGFAGGYFFNRPPTCEGDEAYVEDQCRPLSDLTGTGQITSLREALKSSQQERKEAASDLRASKRQLAEVKKDANELGEENAALAGEVEELNELVAGLRACVYAYVKVINASNNQQFFDATAEVEAVCRSVL